MIQTQKKNEAFMRKQDTDWQPLTSVTREETVARSDAVLARPDIPITQTEDVFRIEALGLEWDIGAMVYQPADPSRAAVGADGKKIGIFMLHGGSGDYKSMEPMAKLFAGKFGCKAVAMTFPGRHYLDDPSRDWPGDTIGPNGSIRTPLWLKGEYITADQYDVVNDTSMRARYGTRTVARAKLGTVFWNRMAGWPMAFETAMKDAMRRHFPEGEYSIYLTGHSTGGPIVFMICQRVPNVAGMIAVENSPFGFIQEKQHDWSGSLGKVTGFERVKTTPAPRSDPFNELYIRTWRDRARYAGPEALGQEGPQALMRLPSLMEEIFDWWDRQKARPQFKAEYIITHNIRASLEAAARASAERLRMNDADTEALVKHYLGYPYPQSGPGAKWVPPVLFCISKDSRDHSPEVYEEVVVPMFATIDPPPKVRVTRWGAGIHQYSRAEEGLPFGIAAPVAGYYVEAIQNGYFLPS
jgi:pimeloyl-ACP methyl ester carboxylesterase